MKCLKMAPIFGQNLLKVCETEYCGMKNSKRGCDLFTDLAFLSSPLKPIEGKWRELLSCGKQLSMTSKLSMTS